VAKRKEKMKYETVTIYRPVEPFFMGGQLFSMKDTPEIPSTYFETNGWPSAKCIEAVREDRRPVIPKAPPTAEELATAQKLIDEANAGDPLEETPNETDEE
jgi:hypothetical protein